MKSKGVDGACTGRAWRHTADVLAIGGLMLLVAGAARAWAEDAAGAPSALPRIATNQGVSLDQRENERPEDGVRPSENSPELAGDGGAPKRADETGEASDAGRMVIRRQGDSKRSGVQYADRGSAWYSRGPLPLFLVLACLGGGFLLVRRWKPSRRVADSSVLEVVARAGITPKHNVALIRLAGRFVLVGISSDRIQALCTISEPEEVAELSVRLGSGSGSGSGRGGRFDSLLAEETTDYNDLEPLEEEASPAAGSRNRVSGASNQLASLLGKLRGLQSQ